MPHPTTPAPQPPPTDDSPITFAEFRKLMSRLDGIERRDTRIETRLCRVLEAHGLDPQGQPSIHSKETTHGHSS